MNDLICRQDAIDALKKIMFTIFFETGEYIGEDTREFSIMNAEKALDVIENLPSAEPKRKRHKWVDGILYHDFDESEWEKVKCSGCENFVIKQIFYNNNKYHFCPNCGADMRGE